jgi:hypothetical protein
MPRRTLTLTDDERAALEAWRDHAARPYARERAGALLKIADGLSPAQVARSGLLRRRKADTVYGWLDRYLAEGLAGLQIRPGRGRKPAFSPPVRGSGGGAGGAAGRGAARSAAVRA